MTMEAVGGETLVQYSYGSPRKTARNPYERFPSRETWTEWEVYERADGTTYRRERKVYRWGEAVTVEPWRVVA